MVRAVVKKRFCGFCKRPFGSGLRRHAKFCSSYCRTAYCRWKKIRDSKRKGKR